MKKKLLTTAITCSLCAACIFGATACKSSGGSDGGAPDVGPSIQVDEAGWAAAIEKTLSATNLTYYCADIESYDKEINKYYSTVYICENEQFNISDVISDYGSGRSYYYTLFEDTLCYTCNTYTGANGWEMFPYGVGWLDEFKVKVGLFSRFSEFTFDGEKYSANWSEDWCDYVIPVTVKINRDGYISYFSFKENYNDIAPDGHTYIYKTSSEYTLYNYGTTTYSVPAEAKKVIEDYKNAKN